MPIPFETMSRRIDIELTSSQADGTWTWRAAGAKNPKGVVDGALLPSGTGVGSVVKVDIEQGIDGMTVLAVVGGRQRSENAERLEILGAGDFVPVIETRAKRDRSDGDRRRKNDGPRRPRRTESKDGEGGREGRRPPRGDKRTGPRFTPPPEMPQRPKPKRLKAQRTHRNAVLAAIPEEQRPIAELALQGMAAVRTRLKAENEKAVAEGRAAMPEASVLKLAEGLMPQLRVADWTDRAEAAKKQADDLDLRDLRSVVAASDDPVVARDKSTRSLADELRELLKSRQEAELRLWFGDVDAALAVGRVIRALRLSSQPPKAGVPFPSEISQRLADSTNATLTPMETSERWIAVLEAAAFSPIRHLITPMGLPPTVSDELRATVTRLAPAIPQIAALFGIEVAANASMPRPLRTNPGRDRREKKAAEKPKKAAKATNAAGDATPSEATSPAVNETNAEEVPTTSADITTESVADEPTGDSDASKHEQSEVASDEQGVSAEDGSATEESAAEHNQSASTVDSDD